MSAEASRSTLQGLYGRRKNAMSHQSDLPVQCGAIDDIGGIVLSGVAFEGDEEVGRDQNETFHLSSALLASSKGVLTVISCQK